ncbi:Methyltransferase [[Actinomadura] parvosata subsp. kistnae]|uniref:rRNA methyltransferase n=1 Tax=[Actinomadura] parvosata subsp. kistnae TaxID=1909395 RepID=A0A1U9ZUQ7_9ACTN|nr:small ribosomal subunit Rsm22 family protein [Nonomuraea sp. ATCC 55076]AQZ61691.1 rRNA methyltransferase [Nonomuraea sp. ATCC 55076]SPL87798.1 Methyltransferase [Actinomadura parvosata subsp. kistnae]
MLPDDLRTALDQALARFTPQELSDAVTRLTERYRVAGVSQGGNHLRTRADVAAYAAYRMPATYAAAAAALRQAAMLTPGFEPCSHLDAGGGTGAAIWAAAGIWPSVERVTVVEHDAHVIDLGRRLARGGPRPLPATTWRQAPITAGLDRPPADLVTMSYALGELPERDRPGVVKWLAEGAAMVVIIEPGTPAGHATVAAARDVLAAQGRTIVAPCPHDGACPIRQGRHWCHFSVRLPRTSLHRRIKAGTLSFEDEKFSYVAATTGTWPRPAARVLRHPQKRKGVVALRLCTEGDGLCDVIVSKRQGDLYREARDVDWGDAWPH